MMYIRVCIQRSRPATPAIGCWQPVYRSTFNYTKVCMYVQCCIL